MFDTLLIPILLGAFQLSADLTDGITTEMCIKAGQQKNIQIYENNPLVYIPFGRQPSVSQFVLSALIDVSITYAAVLLIKRTCLKDVWWIPQPTTIILHINQSFKNYNLYKKTINFK
jgi:hypothetical protein